MKYLNCVLLSLIVLSSVIAQDSPESVGDPNFNPILYWNRVALDAGTIDLDPQVIPTPDQGPATLVQWGLTILHLAMYDAVNAIDGTYTPYLLEPNENYRGASLEAAVHSAAVLILNELYPQQKSSFEEKVRAALAGLPDGDGKARGASVGAEAALAVLLSRDNDGSHNQTTYVPFNLTGVHLADPKNPNQGYVTPGFGRTRPFAVDRFGAGGIQAFRLNPPPTVFSEEYAEAYNEVLDKGADGVVNPTTRTEAELITGLTWAYDGFRGVGTPPKVYTQVIRALVIQTNISLVETAHLFALATLAMGDGMIVAWESKYYYRHWHPVVAIRNGHRDGNPLTELDRDWTPHGVPQSNVNKTTPPLTPAYPSYPSAHAVLSGSMFRMLELYFGTNTIPFEFTSDELNGVTQDAEFGVRDLQVRSFDSFSQASEDSLQSRIYLGVNWRFDVSSGDEAGRRVADFIYGNFFRPRTVEETAEPVVEEAEATEEVAVAEEAAATEEVAVAEEAAAIEEVAVAAEAAAIEEVAVAEEVVATEEATAVEVENIESAESPEIIEATVTAERTEAIVEAESIGNESNFYGAIVDGRN